MHLSGKYWDLWPSSHIFVSTYFSCFTLHQDCGWHVRSLNLLDGTVTLAALASCRTLIHGDDCRIRGLNAAWGLCGDSMFWKKSHHATLPRNAGRLPLPFQDSQIFNVLATEDDVVIDLSQSQLVSIQPSPIYNARPRWMEGSRAFSCDVWGESSQVQSNGWLQNCQTLSS